MTTQRRYRDTRSGQWTTAAENSADPEHVTAETVHVPESITVTDEMVDAATETISRIAATGPAVWWSRPENVEAVLLAALNAREDA